MKHRPAKHLVAKRFNKQAVDYEDATPVQAQMAQHLHNLIKKQCVNRNIDMILEAGCGNGRLTSHLVELFPHATIIAVDLAPDMLTIAKTRCPSINTVCADIEEFIQQGQTYDLIVSNATIQWCHNPKLAIQKMLKKLNLHGLMIHSTFGPQTFTELRCAFEAAYTALDIPQQSHLLDILSTSQWEQAFEQIDITEDIFELQFPDVRSFLCSIQQAGATHAQSNRAIRRDIYQEMCNQYRKSFSNVNGEITATYQAIYMTCLKDGT